jgi:hypothetical protein
MDPPAETTPERKLARTREWAKKADPFFWLVLVGLVPAALAAWAVDPYEPSWALRSVAVYRIEVGLVVFLASYLIALALGNGYKGRSLGKLGLPGGGEVEPKDPALQEASEGAAEFEKETRGGLADLADAIATMNGRVSALEDRRLGERLAQLEDLNLGKRLPALEQSAERSPDERDFGVP